jgi:uncharacterized protein (DUF58 family)
MARAAGGRRRAVLTRRGWTLAGAGAGLIVGSRLLGASALAGLGVGAALLLLFALAWTATRHVTLDLRRSLRPARLHVGSEGRIVLSGRAVGRTPLVTLTDAFDDGRRAARFVLSPQPAGAPVQAVYRVPTNRRGRYTVGPLVASAGDPLGLARRAVTLAGINDLVVCPRVHDVLPPRPGGGGEPAAHDDGPRSPALEPLGEFLALRDYEPGDDPRRVHWRSTARSGELVVRQDEAAAPGRIAVLLDNRAHVHDDASFEAAVEAVASIAVSLQRHRRPVEVLTTTGGVLARPGLGATSLLLDTLAVVDVSTSDHLGDVAASLRGRLGLGAVVAVTGSIDRALLDALALLHRRRLVTAVVTRAAVGSLPARARITVVDAASRPFPEAWNEVMVVPRARVARAGRPRWPFASSRS